MPFLDHIKGTSWAESEKELKPPCMQGLDQGEISPVESKKNASKRNAPTPNSCERKHRAIIRFYVKDSDDKSRYFRDFNLHEACDVFSGESGANDEILPSSYFSATNKYFRYSNAQAVDFGSS